ncbi:MAG: hypothetical protein ACI89E_001474 [Planctomycetota bacterium]|jgi:hypothetical protein
MLIQVALAIAPLLHTPAISAPAVHVQGATSSLAWGVPDDAIIALRINDPTGLITNELENAWIDVMSDPRWLELEVWSEAGMDFDGVSEEYWEIVGPLVHGCTEAVAWVKDFEQDNPSVYIAFRSSSEALSKVNELFPPNATRETVDGIQFIIEGGSAVATRDDLCLIYIGEKTTDDLPYVASVFKSLSALSEPAGLFETTPLGTDRNDEHFELLINLETFIEIMVEEDAELDEMPEAFLEELQAMKWMYMSMNFGAGQVLDSNIVVPYKQDGYLSQLFEFAGEANHEAFSRVPVEAIGALVGNFDIPGAVYWVVEEMMSAEALTEEEFNGALDEMEDTLGFHLLEDFINHMTGDLLQITFPVDELDNEMQSMMAFSYGMMVMDVSDDDSVLRVLTSLMEVAAEALTVAEETNPWGTLWNLDLMGLFELQVGTTSGSMFLSVNPGAVETFVAHAAAGMQTASFRTMDGAGELLNQLGGFYTYLYRTNAIFDSAGTLFENMLGMEDDPDLDVLTEIFEAASEIAGDHLDGLIGSSVSADGRLRFTTIAR